jgi:hypothetical protein
MILSCQYVRNELRFANNEFLILHDLWSVKAMGEQTASEAYQTLIQWLRANQLSWVADRVEDEVTLGKIKAERISVATELFSGGEPSSLSRSQRLRRTSAEFVGHAEYTAEEKFEMAAGAVQAVVVGGVKIQDALAKALGADHTDAEIHFVPGETGGIRHAYRFADLDGRRAVTDEIEKLFAELREDVKSAD